MSRASTTTVFTLGFVAWASGAMAVSVYGFDIYERAWGRGPSFQVLLWIVLAAALLVAVGFSLGAKQLSAPIALWKAAVFSAIYTMALGALNHLVTGYLGQVGAEQSVRLVSVALLSLVSAFIAAKVLARHVAAANQPVQRDAASGRAADRQR